MFGAILGAGVSLLGGLMKNSAENKARRDQRNFDLEMYERQKQDNSFVARRADAEAAGLNPFMALTGGGGYRSSFSSSGATGYVPPLAAVGDGLQMVGDLVANYDPDGQKRAQSESDMRMMLMQAQLENIQSSKRGSRSFGVPISDQKYAGNLAKPSFREWERGKVSVTNPFQKASVNSNYADAEMFEQRYGDIAQELAGARNVVVDAHSNIPSDLSGNISDAINRDRSTLSGRINSLVWPDPNLRKFSSGASGGW